MLFTPVNPSFFADPMPTFDALDGFDVADAVERMLGQQRLWLQALALFVEHFADWEGNWCNSQGDAVRERKSVHALRSSAANIGASRLAACAAALEMAIAEDGASCRLNVLRQDLAEEFRCSWTAASEALAQIARDSGGAL